MSAFLDDAEVIALTGRAQKKKQIEQLRTMGLPFYINAVGRAMVARATIEGKAAAVVAPKPAWVPPGLRQR